MRKAERNVKILNRVISEIKNAANRQVDSAVIAGWLEYLEPIARGQYSSDYADFFSDITWVNQLLFLYKSTEFNKNMLFDFIFLTGYLVQKYHLSPTDELFDLFYGLKDSREFKFYVAMFITCFPQFHAHEKRWEYLLSIPELRPYQEAGEKFHAEIKAIIDTGEDIPAAIKSKIVAVYNRLLRVNNKEMEKDLFINYSRNKYIESEYNGLRQKAKEYHFVIEKLTEGQ